MSVKDKSLDGWEVAVIYHLQSRPKNLIWDVKFFPVGKKTILGLGSAVMNRFADDFLGGGVALENKLLAVVP